MQCCRPKADGQLGTDLYPKEAAIPGSPMLFFSHNGYPESQLLTQAQLTSISSPPSFCANRKGLWPDSEEQSFFTYCIFTSSQLHPTDPTRLLCKVMLPLPQMKTVAGYESRVYGYVITLPMRSFVKLVLLSSEPQKLSCNTLTKLRHYLEVCN